MVLSVDARRRHFTLVLPLENKICCEVIRRPGFCQTIPTAARLSRGGREGECIPNRPVKSAG